MIVAFHDSVRLDNHGSSHLPLANQHALGTFWSHLTRFQQGFGTHAAGTALPLRGQGRQLIAFPHSLGYKYGKDKLGNPTYPARVWHPAGLFPTVLASGNAGILRWPKLRAMCPPREAFNTWAHAPHAAAGPAGCIHERRPMPSECLSAKGFPADTLFNSDNDGFRFAGNAVPPTYFKKLFLTVTDVLDRAEVPLVLPRKPDEYITYAKYPLHPNDIVITASQKPAGKPAKKGQNVSLCATASTGISSLTYQSHQKSSS